MGDYDLLVVVAIISEATVPNFGAPGSKGFSFGPIRRVVALALAAATEVVSRAVI